MHADMAITSDIYLPLLPPSAELVSRVTVNPSLDEAWTSRFGQLHQRNDSVPTEDMVAAVAASKAEAAGIGDIIEQRFTGGSSLEGSNVDSIVSSLRRWATSGTQVKVHVMCHDLLPGVGDENARALLAGTVRWFDEKLNILLQPARLLAYKRDDGTTVNNPHNQLGWVYIRCHQVAAISALTDE
ncbi:conserved hypothetical protein [Neospora caninum Liverpool]|uniref:LSM domain-containing protein n=1 Tax=Neospora caninum (strain Liverpool) TaxID=572307 RepID=F0VLT4_NEOCL|nr:conserved hypothetical protein [Neospora caninum Liverpool]CBZ54212.1 conserved hypothetical protein [Neospora caninum Liverpool]|eukprot:XP_003884243.1 conserved hypothetical protein [Neospora caninum Liverpool]